jgi:hypothetical protein
MKYNNLFVCSEHKVRQHLIVLQSHLAAYTFAAHTII